MDTFKAIVLSPNAKADTALVNIQGKLDKLRQDLERLRSENEILTRERDEAVIDLGYFKNETQRLEHQLIEALAPKDTENTFSKMRGNTNQIAIKSSPEQPQSGLGLWVSAHPSINKLEAQLREIECERDSWKDLAKKYQDERCRAVAEVERYKEQATSYKKTPSYQPSPKTVALRRYWSHRKAQQPNPPTRTPHFPGLVSKPSGQQTTTTARPTQTLKREAERASPSILPSSGPMRVSAQQAAATGSGQTIKREAELPNPNISTIPGLKREHPDELGPFKRRKIELATDGKKDQGQGLGTASCPVCID